MNDAAVFRVIRRRAKPGCERVDEDLVRAMFANAKEFPGHLAADLIPPEQPGGPQTAAALALDGGELVGSFPRRGSVARACRARAGSATASPAHGTAHGPGRRPDVPLRHAAPGSLDGLVAT
jgi:hypothetical protein